MLVLGLRGDFAFNTHEAPFYQLSGLDIKGIEKGRYVDDIAASIQAELRYDFTERWTAVGFGGVGRVSDDIGDIFSSDDQIAGGIGFRYLIAREYGIRMGADLAYGDDEFTLYITVGTGWTRP